MRLVTVWIEKLSEYQEFLVDTNLASEAQKRVEIELRRHLVITRPDQMELISNTPVTFSDKVSRLKQR